MDCNWDYSGQSGIITGAASGIGASLARLLATSGAELALVDRDKKRLEAVAQECADLGSSPLTICADMSKREDIQRMIDGTLAGFGKINFLVTSAGIIYRSQFLDIDLDEWDEVMDTNVRGVFMCNQMVVARMLEQGGGRIVNISSVAGRSISLIGGAHYCTSKHAVIGMTRHMARELCQQGIRANAFCPGATHTPMIHDNMDAGEVEGLEQRIALGRL
ncbi:MAG: SDR family oxidoreductase, partial [Proteobacteria bacterium]|nr:SDR family oxidoreductase [Pseudomonadota bacterium]